MPRRLTLLLALLLLGAPTAAHARVPLGFADQKPSMFSDVRFTDLHVSSARVNVPWDVFSDRSSLPAFTAWMQGAKRDGVTVLLTVNRSRRPGRASVNPTNAQMTTLIRTLRKRFPGQVNEISTWNEANINKQPGVVVGWYGALRRGCASCKILGADLVDKGNEVRWAQTFVRLNGGRAPKYWGLHNYVDVNNYSSARTLAFARAVPGAIWLTETGGVLSRLHPGSTFAGTGDAHAAKATRYLLDTMLAKPDLKAKVQKVYLYSWSTSVDDLSWDSGMIGPTGKQRTMLAVVRRYLGVPYVRRPNVPPPPSSAIVVPES